MYDAAVEDTSYAGMMAGVAISRSRGRGVRRDPLKLDESSDDGDGDGEGKKPKAVKAEAAESSGAARLPTRREMEAHLADSAHRLRREVVQEGEWEVRGVGRVVMGWDGTLFCSHAYVS